MMVSPAPSMTDAPAVMRTLSAGYSHDATIAYDDRAALDHAPRPRAPLM